MNPVAAAGRRRFIVIRTSIRDGLRGPLAFHRSSRLFWRATGLEDQLQSHSRGNGEGSGEPRTATSTAVEIAAICPFLVRRAGVLNSCRSICKATTVVPAPDDHTGNYHFQSDSPVERDRPIQWIHQDSLLAASVIFVVKLSPELLRSMVCPKPDFSGGPCFATVKRASKLRANLALARRSRLGGFRYTQRMLAKTLHDSKYQGRWDLTHQYC